MSSRRAGPLVVIALLIAGWELTVRAGLIDELLVASPTDTVAAIAGDLSGFAESFWVTTREAVFGLLIAAAVGVTVGTALHLSSFLRDVTLPLLIGSQSLPLVVIAPLLVIALGFGITAKLVIVALVCFFPIAVGTFDGLRATDPELLTLMRSLGAGRARVLRLVELPSALPRILSGTRVAATWAYIGAVFAEYAGATGGLGYLIARGTPTLQTSRVYAAVLILALSSMALYSLMLLIERRFAPWANRLRTD